MIYRLTKQLGYAFGGWVALAVGYIMIGLIYSLAEFIMSLTEYVIVICFDLLIFLCIYELIAGSINNFIGQKSLHI